MLLNIPNWLELLSALLCTIFLIHKPLVVNKWFVLFLWATATIELLGIILTSEPKIKIAMYNIFNIAEFIFYLSFLYYLTEIKWLKKVIIFSLVPFIVYSLLNLIFSQGFYVYNSNTHTLGSVMLISVCLLKFYEISITESNFLQVLKWPLICIISGLLIYYSGNLTNSALFNYQINLNPDNAVKLYKLINHSLNIVLYILFIIAFIIENRLNKMASRIKIGNLKN